MEITECAIDRPVWCMTHANDWQTFYIDYVDADGTIVLWYWAGVADLGVRYAMTGYHTSADRLIPRDEGDATQPPPHAGVPPTWATEKYRLHRRDGKGWQP